MKKLSGSVLALLCLLALGSCANQSEHSTASKTPEQSAATPTTTAPDIATPPPVIPTPTESGDWKANLPTNDYGEYLLSRVSADRVIDENDVDFTDWVWNHLAQYDGKHEILAAAYVTGFYPDKKPEVKLYEGSLTTLGKDLAKADESQVLAPGEGCLLYYEGHPQVWILTDDGSIYQVRWPRDRCEHNMEMDTKYPFISSKIFE